MRRESEGTVFTATNETTNYSSPLIGNGEITTTLGPTGYHNGFCPERETVNRTIFWAGRRLNTPTHALVRFGQLDRSLKVNDAETRDDLWQQRVDYDQGSVVSRLDHGSIIEETRSLVCLTASILVFHTTLENQSGRSVRVEFSVNYWLNRTIDTRLLFPFMTHFDFRPGYEPRVSEEVLAQIKTRVQSMHHENSLRVCYHINEQLGEVRLGWSYDATVRETNEGGTVTCPNELNPGERIELWTWVMLSDRQHYTHFPNFDRVRELLQDHARGWSDFWNTSTVELADERLNALRKTSLYAIRCSASPWSVPPAYLATHWEGRTFHDELYPFLGLISSGHYDLASRIPKFRSGTLNVALARSGYRGASFPWETLEDGYEGGPYGHWMDERFHIGQFAVTAWQYYLYVQDVDDLKLFFPLLRGCAERFVQDVLIRDQAGRLATRLVTDFDEAVFPLVNGIFTICAAVRSLEIAAQAAEILGVETAKRDQWRHLASELREALPIHDEEQYYKVSDDSNQWHIAQVGMVYPFLIDVHSELARETMTRLTNALSTAVSSTAGNSPDYEGSHWLWTTALMATAFFYQNRADDGFALLKTAPNCVGPFFAPNEQKIVRNGKTHDRLPWFTTSAGAFVYALNAMIAYVIEGGTVLLNGVPELLQELRFTNLSGSHGVRISGQIEDGRISSLRVWTEKELRWTAFMPVHVIKRVSFTPVCSVSASEVHGLREVTCDLDVGETDLIIP
jgi:hypothetical protein